MRSLNIQGRIVGDDHPSFVIAEIGNNHQGSLEKCRDFFRSAKECGADAVKLQKRDNRGLYTRKLYDSPYASENSFGDTYGAHREALEFGREEYVDLKAYADELDLIMFATAWDFKSADFLAELDMPLYKIASGDLINTPLLKHVAAIGKPMIVSTGGGTMDDVQRAYDAIMPINPQLCLLQCTAAYPVEPHDMNLRVITTLRERFPEVVVGLSDHQNGIALSMVAYALGSRVVEKHFTLNRAWKGTDHAFSLEPVGLKKLVRDLHRAYEAMGDGVKRRIPSEEGPLKKMQKSIVAAHALAEGTVLTLEHLALKSPNGGLPPYELDQLLGRRLKRALEEDEFVRWDDVS